MRARAAALLLAVALPVLPAPGLAQDGAGPCTLTIREARYDSPTGRYGHGVLPGGEWSELEVGLDRRGPCGTAPDRIRVKLPEALVYEDVAPLVSDLDGDGRPELVVVESHAAHGSRIAVYRASGAGSGAGLARRAVTGFIGTRHRWVALLGAADLDGDGRKEIVAIDRPHLMQVLRIFRYHPAARGLVQIAAAPGHTNHRIGDAGLLGGLRTCGIGTEIVTATPDWSRLQISAYAGGPIVTRDGGPNTPARLAALLDCR